MNACSPVLVVTLHWTFVRLGHYFLYHFLFCLHLKSSMLTLRSPIMYNNLDNVSVAWIIVLLITVAQNTDSQLASIPLSPMLLLSGDALLS